MNKGYRPQHLFLQRRIKWVMSTSLNKDSSNLHKPTNNNNRERMVIETFVTTITAAAATRMKIYANPMQTKVINKVGQNPHFLI